MHTLTDYDKLSALNDKDKKFILQRSYILMVYPVRDAFSQKISDVEFAVDTTELSEVDLLVSELEDAERRHDRSSDRRNENSRIIANHTKRSKKSHFTQELNKLGLKDPNPFTDLWAWYAKWSSGAASLVPI